MTDKDRLPPIEREIVELIEQGMSIKAAADKLCIPWYVAHCRADRAYRRLRNGTDRIAA